MQSNKTLLTSTPFSTDSNMRGTLGDYLKKTVDPAPLKSSLKKVTFDEPKSIVKKSSRDYSRPESREYKPFNNHVTYTSSSRIIDGRVIRDAQPLTSTYTDTHNLRRSSPEPRVIRSSNHKIDSYIPGEPYRPRSPVFSTRSSRDKIAVDQRVVRVSPRRETSTDARLMYSQQVVNSPFRGPIYTSTIDKYTPTVHKSYLSSNPDPIIQKSYISTKPDPTIEISNNNVVNELKFQIAKKDAEISRLENDNNRLRREAETLTIVRGRLDEASADKQRMEGTTVYLESTIKSLKEEIQRLTDRNVNLQQQVNTIMNHNPGQYRHDGNSVYTKREWDLAEEKKALETKLFSVEKERDRLYIENYEFKRAKGIADPDLDMTSDEMAQMSYQNELQIAQLTIRKLDRRYKRLEEERSILHRELQVLRALDTVDEAGVRRDIIRPTSRPN